MFFFLPPETEGLFVNRAGRRRQEEKKRKGWKPARSRKNIICFPLGRSPGQPGTQRPCEVPPGRDGARGRRALHFADASRIAHLERSEDNSNEFQGASP